MFQPLLVAFNDPEGWDALMGAIKETPFSEVATLRGRTFNLVVPGATDAYELAVEPENAFKVERFGIKQFQVTIIDPEALVIRKLIVKYQPIGWRLKSRQVIDPSFTGKGNCSYNITFSQNGVGELDLPKYDVDYDITCELSNKEAILSIKREGRGYAITRVRNSSAEAKVRLRIKEKAGGDDFLTDWVTIPTCGTAEAVQTPTYTPAPPASPLSASPPLPNPADLLDVTIASVSHCEDATGKLCATLHVTVSNKGSRTVKCNQIWFYMKDGDKIIASNSTWVSLDGGGSTSFDMDLKAPYQPQVTWGYSHKKTDCFYR